MAFRFSSSSTSSSSPSSRPIKAPKHAQSHPSCNRQQFSVPNGPNWVYASGGSRIVRFDFTKALDEQLASEDETCGSSQEYYARKSADSSSKGSTTFVPPVLPACNTDPRLLYPTQRRNYAFNFDRATPADIDNMNTALPFGPMLPPERKQRSRKDLEKCPRQSVAKLNPFEFGDKTTTFSAHAPPSLTAVRKAKTLVPAGSTTLTARSQNHDDHAPRTSSVKPSITVTGRK